MSPRAAIESMVSSPAWPRGQGFRMRRRIMVGSMRWTGTVLACLSFFAVSEVAGRESPSSPDGPGQEPAAKASAGRPARQGQAGIPDRQAGGRRGREAGRRGVLQAAGRRTASSARPAPRQHGRRPPADRGAAALLGGPGARGPAVLRRGRGAAPAGTEARPRVGRDHPPAEPALPRGAGQARPGRRVRQEGAGDRARRHRHAQHPGRVLQPQERPRGRARPC